MIESLPHVENILSVLGFVEDAQDQNCAAIACLILRRRYLVQAFFGELSFAPPPRGSSSSTHIQYLLYTALCVDCK